VKKRLAVLMFLPPAFAGFLLLHVQSASSQTPPGPAKDPGVRNGSASAGAPLPGLTPSQAAHFAEGKLDFEEVETVADGLGPTMNLDGCRGCHSQPATGGTSPAVNPQVAFAATVGNAVPSFISKDGPIREARFIRNSNGTPDGGVHSLFTNCGPQENFEREVRNRNVIFRIPTPVFGAGLIEQIPDSEILKNLAANGTQKRSFGIGGRVNRVRVGTITGQPNMNGNDGTISRFGWKAQNQSLLLFSGEAYNVEMGISNELFPQERRSCPSARAAVPNDVTTEGGLSGIELFALFMRFLAPPTPSPGKTPEEVKSIESGRNLFTSTGCALCHTPTLKTGTGKTAVAVMWNRDVNLYSDLVVHNMGPGLADGVTQGQAGPQDFRTAPLWGLGQRIFFLHDGRTSDLLVAIQAHASGSTGNASEANAVTAKFNQLSESQKQDVLNFLRSL
jgi:CxxC motif-containing protein (DUF1111 family)